jgi:hypothetical protein
MTKPDSDSIWNIKLDFNLREAKKEASPPPAPKIPPRVILRHKFPQILHRIEMIWGSIELHNYLEKTLTTERTNRQGFPRDVIQALNEIHMEHKAMLKANGVLKDDLWDTHFNK